MSKFDLVPFLQHLENGHFGVQDMSVVVVVVVVVVLTTLIYKRLWYIITRYPKALGP